jgi:hypothetical protein
MTLVAYLGLVAAAGYLGTPPPFVAVPVAGTPGLVTPTAPPDSADTLRDVQRRMAAYVREMRRDAARSRRWSLPADRARAREERTRMLEELDEAAEAIPGDDWIVGHRVGMRVKAARLDEALTVAESCEASPWWCRALEGFVLHVEGDSLAAHLAFDEALEGMEPEERCEWQEELGEILVGSMRRPYNRAGCEELAELAPRMWWLADPFHLLPWNDWRSEHLARLVGMRLHHQSLALVAERCTPDHHMRILLYGWPDWWWGYDHGWGTPHPPSHRFLPPSAVAADPFGSSPWDWDLVEDRYLERMDLGYELIHGLEQQTAFFRRGDSVLVAASAEMDRHILRGATSLTTGVVLSRGPAAAPLVASEVGAPSHVRFRLMVPEGEYLVSVESIADTWGSARARFGHRLPDPSPSGAGLSDLLLFDWEDGDGGGGVAEDFIPRMLGTSTLASDRNTGIFWETYGVEEGTSLELSLRVLPTEEGFFRRWGRRLGVAGRAEAARLSWSETAGVPAGRALRLDLSGLDPGRYVMELRATPEGGAEPAVVRRHLEVDWR